MLIFNTQLSFCESRNDDSCMKGLNMTIYENPTLLYRRKNVNIKFVKGLCI